MDYGFILSSMPLYIKAARLTVELAFWGILLSLFIGAVCAMISYYKIKGLQQLAAVYIEVSRNTPLLIQLFFLYYGLAKLGIKLEAHTCAIAGLAFLGGSYMAEAFRAGLEAVSRSQIETGLSLGLNSWQLLRYVIFPQALRIAAPPLAANVIFLLKETSVVSAIALADLMFVAKDLIGMYYKTSEALLLLVLFYLLLLLPISFAFSYLERRLQHD